MENSRDKLSDISDAENAVSYPVTLHAPDWMPSRELADRIRRWGLVAEAVYVVVSKELTYIELSLTLRGKKKPSFWSHDMMFGKVDAEYTGHTFRSVIPPTFVPTQDGADGVWISVAQVCEQKLTLRTLQPVENFKAEREVRGKMRCTGVNMDWDQIAKATGIPNEFFGFRPDK